MGGDWKELLTAAEKGDVDLAKYHLLNGIDPNYQHPELLTTPLIEAAMYGHLEIVELLLANGAKPEIRGVFDGYTALEVAKIKRHKKVIQILEKAMNIPSNKADKTGFLNRFLR
ncbi:MAG: ankyrin repeat domain-containing protein [Saprospiraceae bacterium]